MDRFTELRKLPPGRIAYRIRQYRGQYGITQEALAARLGIKRYTLLRWENARVKISNIMLRLLMAEGVL